MNIYTSYFAKLNKIDKEKYHPISISLRVPEGINISKYRILSPTSSMFNDFKLTHNKEKYINEYMGYINTMDPKEIYNNLERISGGKDCVLVCYEKSGEFCHRRLLAEWLEKNLNIEVKELDI